MSRINLILAVVHLSCRFPERYVSGRLVLGVSLVNHLLCSDAANNKRLVISSFSPFVPTDTCLSPRLLLSLHFLLLSPFQASHRTLYIAHCTLHTAAVALEGNLSGFTSRLRFGLYFTNIHMLCIHVPSRLFIRVEN